MSRTLLSGLNGANPLGFMASVGLLRVLNLAGFDAKLGFLSDGSFQPFIDNAPDNLPGIIADDAARAGEQPWMLEYEKVEKNGVKRVRDLKAPPEQFERFLQECIDLWRRGVDEPVAYAAAFGTSAVRDGKGNTKPTAFHFTAANMQFLAIADLIRTAVTAEWAERSLFEGYATRQGSNLRWDPASERNWALMANNPNNRGTEVDAPLEWLAFRGLPLFPTFPVRGFRRLRAATTAVSGRGDEMKVAWPLWECPASMQTVRSMLHLRWEGNAAEHRGRGVFAVCTSGIRRTSQGFGNFGPAAVSA